MSKRQKREERIRENVTNVSLDDFEVLIRDYGYIETGGKHPKAIIGRFTMPYKRENPVKSCYVKELLGIIDSMKK